MQDRPRRRWPAAVLSLSGPGLGHAYAGRLQRGLAMLLITQVLVTLGVVAFAYGRTSLVMLASVVLVQLGITVWVAVDAVRCMTSDRPRARTTLKRCATFALVLLAVMGAADAARTHWIGDAMRFPSGGMLPTLFVGDHAYINAWALRGRDPRRGEIVVFALAREGSAIYPADRRPDLPREMFVKRVVGVPGDVVSIDSALLHVNGRRWTDPTPVATFDADGTKANVLEEATDGSRYQVLDDPALTGLRASDVVVERGRFFVVGDNRDHSNDSRNWGTVRREEITGVVTSIYWSWDFPGSSIELLNPARLVEALRNHTRWDRIGRKVE